MTPGTRFICNCPNIDCDLGKHGTVVRLVPPHKVPSYPVTTMHPKTGWVEVEIDGEPADEYPTAYHESELLLEEPE